MAKRIVWTGQARDDLRHIDQQTALQILKTLARYVSSGEGDTKQLQGVEPPLLRLRSQDHRVFFRETGDYLKSIEYCTAEKPTGRSIHRLVPSQREA